MRNLARIYGALLRAALAEAIEYRAQALFWMLSAVFPLVMMVVWLAVLDEAGPALGWSGADFISYYVGAAMLSRFTFTWSAWNWSADISKGGLSVKLLRPCDPAHHALAEQLGWKLFDLLTVVPIVSVVALLTPSISFPLDPARFAALLLSVAVGFLVNEFMAYTFGVIAFWTTQSGTLYGVATGVGQFLSGWIAPLDLFPAPLRALAGLLPFQATVGLPVEILIGRAGWPEIWAGLGVAAAWAAIFFALYRALYTLGLRRYEAVGA